MKFFCLSLLSAAAVAQVEIWPSTLTATELAACKAWAAFGTAENW